MAGVAIAETGSTCQLLRDLAAASLSDSSVRMQLVWYLLEAGNSSKTVAEILELLYGTAPQPLHVDDINSDFDVAGRQAQALLKLVGLYSCIESIRAKIALVYGTNLSLSIENPTASLVKSEQATLDAKHDADGESSSGCGDQYVQVDHPSEKFADFDAIPKLTSGYDVFDWIHAEYVGRLVRASSS